MSRSWVIWIRWGVRYCSAPFATSSSTFAPRSPPTVPSTTSRGHCPCMSKELLNWNFSNYTLSRTQILFHEEAIPKLVRKGRLFCVCLDLLLTCQSIIGYLPIYPIIPAHLLLDTWASNLWFSNSVALVGLW